MAVWGIAIMAFWIVHIRLGGRTRAGEPRGAPMIRVNSTPYQTREEAAGVPHSPCDDPDGYMIVEAANSHRAAQVALQAWAAARWDRAGVADGA